VRLAILVILVMAGCERDRGSPPGAAAPGPASPPLFELRGDYDQIRASDRQLGDVEVGWIAEAERGDYRVAIVWLGLRGARVLDNDVGGFTFARDGGRWRLAPVPGRDHAEVGPMTGGEDRLREVLGGDYRLIKPDGLPVDQLGPHVLATSRRFRDALAAGDVAAAIAAFEDGSRAFGPRLIVFDNAGVDALIEGRLAGSSSLDLRDVELSGDRGRAVVEVQGRTVVGAVELVRAGTGWAIDALE
jgi:hypothetical protein